MAKNGQKQSSQEIFSGAKNFKTHHNIWQDKSADTRDRTASPQPASVENVMRSQKTNKDNPRSQKKTKPRGKRRPATLWLLVEDRAELHRLAKEKGLSVSQTGAALLEEALRWDMYKKQGALLQPIIEQAIRKEMRTIATKLSWLMVRIALDGGQTRSIVTNILGRQVGVTPEVLKKILEGSSKTARGNIIRKSPQIRELVKAIEGWLMEEGEPGYTKN